MHFAVPGVHPQNVGPLPDPPSLLHHHFLRKAFHGKPEFLHQALVGFSLFDQIQILALKVFNQRKVRHGLIVGFDPRTGGVSIPASLQALKRRSPATIIYLPFRGVTTIGSRSPFSMIDWASSSKAFGSNSFPFLDQDLQPQLPNRVSSSTSKSAGQIQSL